MMLARPGSGKSTQSAALAEALGIVHVGSGMLLRREVAGSSPLGRAVAPFLDSGTLVPDELVTAIVIAELDSAVARGGYVLDGFPRNLTQWKTLAFNLPAAHQSQFAVFLDVNAEECRRRLLARAQMEGRSDDSPEVIERRLAAYERDLKPLLDRFAGEGILVAISGTGSAEMITKRILDRLGAH
jgi:adenylate kinase